MSRKYWKPLSHLSSWRKISVGMWGRPADPTIYGHEEIDVHELLPYLEELSEVTGERITLTTYIIKIIADIFARYPDLNTVVIANRVMRREHINMFVQVAIPGQRVNEADLSGVKLRDVDQQDFVDIARSLRQRAQKVRNGQDAEMEQTKSMIDKVPPILLPLVVRLVDILTYVVPIDLDALGIRSDPFGSAMVSSVGQFDIIQGFAPLVPASRCPLVAIPGKVHEAPKVVDGQIVARKCCTISFTLDHRCYDGYQIGLIASAFRSMLNHPRQYYPAPEAFAHKAQGAPTSTLPGPAPAAPSPGGADAPARTPKKPEDVAALRV